jgi:hypothetical protein
MSARPPQGTHSVRRIFPAISDSLQAAVLGTDYGKPPARKERKLFHGATAARGAPLSKFSDEAVLMARRLHEIDGLTYEQVADRMQGGGTQIDPGQVRNLCKYVTRVHLDPKRVRSAEPEARAA